MKSYKVLLISLALFAIIILVVPLNAFALDCPAGQIWTGYGCAPSGQTTPSPSLPNTNTSGQTGGGQSSQQVTTPVSLPNPLAANDITQLVDNIATWLLTIGLILSTIVIIWSAIQFMVSGGNKTIVESARKTIWYAVIGIVVLLLAKGITSLIAGFLGG